MQETDGRDFRVEGNDVSEYDNVSPEYMTYAEETQRPLADNHSGESPEEADESDDDEQEGESEPPHDPPASGDTQEQTATPITPSAPPTA